MENLSDAGVSPGTHWRVWVALLALVLIIGLNLSWPWGVLLILWVLPSATSGSIHFVEEVQAERSPFLFASVVLTWLTAGVYLIAIDLF